MSTAPHNEGVRVLRVIARMNIGGPAYHVSLLSGRLGPPYRTLLATGTLGAGEGSFEALPERFGARLVKIPGLGPSLVPWRDMRALVAMMLLIRRTRPQIVHTHTAKAGFIGRAAALSVRPRPIIVHTYHGHVLSGYFGPTKTVLFRALERLLGRVSDCLVAVSESTKQELVELGVAPADRFEVIPLGLDLDRFLRLGVERDSRLAAQIGARQDEIVCTFVGRLVPIKRVDVLLDAWAILARRCVPARLVIVGDGELRRHLEAQAHRLSLEAWVSFLGVRHDLEEVAAGTDIAVLSSDHEGTPVALIEAAAAGRPAVATAVGGVHDVVSPDTGRLVPPGDAPALAAVIAELVADPAACRRMGSNARKHVKHKYAAQRLLDDVEMLYSRLRETR